jgi:hypothetical protein
MPDQIIVPVEPGFTTTFKGYDGPVGRDLLARGRRVQYAAQRQVGVRTDRLRQSIRVAWFRTARGDLGVRVGSNINYALMHHTGTRPHVIRPRHAKMLRFVNKSGMIVFAKVVHHPGTRPNRYLSDNLPLAVR